MTDLNELKLDKWQGSSFEPERSRKGWTLAVVAVLLVALAAAGVLLYRRREQPAPAAVRSATEQAVAPAAPARASP